MNTLEKLSGKNIEDFNSLIESVAELKPRDLLEAQIIAQSIALFNQTMDLFGKINNSDSNNVCHEDIKLADRLIKTSTRLLEVFSKHRRDGMQQMVIQKVNISEGGQAIVGSNISR